jgi:hypothetical protein
MKVREYNQVFESLIPSQPLEMRKYGIFGNVFGSALYGTFIVP